MCQQTTVVDVWCAIVSDAMTTRERRTVPLLQQDSGKKFSRYGFAKPFSDYTATVAPVRKNYGGVICLKMAVLSTAQGRDITGMFS